MKVLVTGARGQLGYDAVNELRSRGHEAVGVDLAEMDITDAASVQNVLRREQPDAVIHCAAWTEVDAAEDAQNREKVFAVNADGTKYIAEATKRIDAKLLFVSTDYVFEGNGNKPYKADDERKGLSVYGKSKIAAENFVITITNKYYIVRTTWAFGKNGNNFVKTMLKLADEKSEINVVNDQIGSPTYTYDLARLLVDMVETDKYGIYHATNEGCCSCYEFAKEIFRQTGKTITVNPVSTKEYLMLVPMQAKRPLNSRLDKSKLIENGFMPLPTWQDALRRYLDVVGARSSTHGTL